MALVSRTLATFDAGGAQGSFTLTYDNVTLLGDHIDVVVPSGIVTVHLFDPSTGLDNTQSFTQNTTVPLPKNQIKFFTILPNGRLDFTSSTFEYTISWQSQ